MKIVYLVAAHYDPEAFASLLDAVDGAPVIAHIDAKTDITPFVSAAGPNVTFTERRVNVLWGGWSQVESTLTMMRAASGIIEPDDYVVLLSGDTYPLQAQDDIVRFFQAGSAAQYINSVPMPSREVTKPITRLSRLYVEYNPRNGKRNLLPKIINKLGIPRKYKTALNGRTPHAGSTWWAFTGAAVAFVVAEAERDTTFTKFCKWTKMPDEFFFQTLIANSPYAGNVRPSLMFTDWSRPTGPKPAVLDAVHVLDLQQRRLTMEQPAYGDSVALFARKVKSPAMTEKIRDELWTSKAVI